MTEEKMWQVPPVQFVVDNTVRGMREVDEQLTVADMGPDFEPRLLTPSHPHPQKTTNSSYQSDVINLSEVPGPGGSVELVTSQTGRQQPSFAQLSETWNSISENTGSLQTPEDSTSEKLDKLKIGCDEAVSDNGQTAPSIQNESHYCVSKNSKAADSDNAQYMSDMRSNIYGLDHDRLWQQVLLAKRKSVNRSYELSDELLGQYAAAADSAKMGSTRDLLAHSKMRKRNKNGRHSRNRDDILSCHYHNSVEHS